MRNDPRNLSLQAPDSPPGSTALVERYAVYQSAPESQEAQEPVVPLSHYFWTIRRHKWSLLSFIVVAVAATIIVSSRLTPFYEATATLDVDRMIPTGVIGQESNSGRVGNNDTDQFLSTQIELIRSDSVLRPVARRFKMGRVETGKPKVGPTRAEQAPIGFPGLRITRPPKTYLLRISYRSPDPEFAAQVANAIAESYKDHTFEIRYRASADLTAFMDKQLEELHAKMERSSAAQVQFEKDLGVISPEQKTNILSARLLQLNTDYTTAQTERIKKEAALNSVRGGTFEALEVSGQGEQIRQFVQKVADETAKFALVKAQYGANQTASRWARWGI